MAIQNLYPTNKHAIIKVTAQYLGKDKSEITYQDVDQFKNYINDALHNHNQSPTQIKNELGIEYSDFGTFIRVCLGIPTKNSKAAVNNFMQQSGKAITDELLVYRKACAFTFDVYKLPKIQGYELLKTHKFQQLNNGNSIHRDHMVSVAYGFANNIDPKVISHPANCHIMLADDNVKKNSACSITLEQLEERISIWDSGLLADIDSFIIRKTQPKSKKHKANIGSTMRNMRSYTNGTDNIRQNKDLPIPVGYWSGLTRHKK